MTARWIALLWIVTAGLPAWGQTPAQGHFLITTRQVLQPLREKGMKVDEGQVSLVASVVANDPNPVLDIVSDVPPLGDQSVSAHEGARTWVKLACHLPGTCLPFYALVDWTNGEPETPKSVSGSALPGAMSNPSLTVTMRAGAHATLVMGDERCHIQVAVISLENGIVGHKIRLTSPDRKQVYVGEVVSATLLKGSY